MSEKNGLLNLKLPQQFWEHHFRFVMHEVEAAFFGEALRFPVAIPRIRQNAAARRVRHALREIPPHGDRAETFVEHDNG